jgi:hypothetical protein
MTLNETLLQKLTEWPPAAGDRQTLTVHDEGSGWTVAVTADRRDELGCLLWEMTLKRAAVPTTGGGPALKAWAGRAAERVTGLLEPLKVVEVDLVRNEALLRSEEPAQRGEDRYYYEVLRRGSLEAIVRRYHGSRQPGGRREQVPFALTHEAIAKLAADLATD